MLANIKQVMENLLSMRCRHTNDDSSRANLAVFAFYSLNGIKSGSDYCIWIK
jgi:hypothetical protein